MTTNTGTYQENPPEDVDFDQEEWKELSYDMQYYYANDERREYLVEKAQEITERNAEYVRNYKEEGKCYNCDESFRPALEFHHVQGEKTANIGQFVYDEYSIERIKEEIDKCVLICANCHRKAHYGNLSFDTA